MQDSQIEYVDSERLVTDPLVSVVMITYNHERYLADAIEGVLRQETSFPVELLIGEDCSTDGTRNIALGYQKRFPEMIRVITSEQNVGMHKNFARLIAAARGKYIAFCEGDDYWHRIDKLKLQIDCFRADESHVLVSTGMRTVSAAGEVIPGAEPSDSAVRVIEVEYRDILFGRFFHPTCSVVARTWAVRRALTGNSLCSDHTLLIGDLPLWLELSQLGRMSQLPERLATYRRSPQSATRRNDALWGWHVAMSSFEVRYRALERYPLPGPADRTTEAMVEFARKLLRTAAKVGAPRVARSQAVRLRRLGAKLTWEDFARLVLAFVPLPRRVLTLIYRDAMPRLGRC